MKSIASARIQALQRTIQHVPSDSASPELMSRADSSYELQRNTAFTLHFERTLGDSELAYYLPSREDGVNDIIINIGFNASETLVNYERLRVIWATLLLRHPLMVSKIKMNSYTDVRFCYDAPSSVDKILEQADRSLALSFKSMDEILDDHLNGPRVLSSDCLVHLTISKTSDSSSFPSSCENVVGEYVWSIRVAHFVGDAVPVQYCANDFFALLGGPLTNRELYVNLCEEWQRRWGKGASSNRKSILPLNMEEKLPSHPKTKLYDAASRVDFAINQTKQIGGHTLSKHKSPKRSVISIIDFDEERTNSMVRRCKDRGVSITCALFAACNIAWAKMCKEDKRLPMMLYSALNIRPLLRPDPSQSYWFLSIGYFNIILPAFLPPSSSSSESERMFWHRARSVQDQCAQATKGRMLVPRTREMAKERASRARAWAKEDDEKAARVSKHSVPAPLPAVAATPLSLSAAKPVTPPPSSTAFMGISSLGNLDRVYARAPYPSIRLKRYTCGSRQRAGGSLIHAYTFDGRFGVSLAWDKGGFVEGEMEEYWEDVKGCLDEFLG